MQLSIAEFQKQFKDGQEKVLQDLAFDADITPDQFYSIACFLENTSFFIPLIFDTMLQNKCSSGDGANETIA